MGDKKLKRCEATKTKMFLTTTFQTDATKGWWWLRQDIFLCYLCLSPWKCRNKNIQCWKKPILYPDIFLWCYSMCYISLWLCFQEMKYIFDQCTLGFPYCQNVYCCEHGLYFIGGTQMSMWSTECSKIKKIVIVH